MRYFLTVIVTVKLTLFAAAALSAALTLSLQCKVLSVAGLMKIHAHA